MTVASVSPTGASAPAEIGAATAAARLFVWGLAGLVLLVGLLVAAWGVLTPMAAAGEGLTHLWWYLPGARIDQNPVLWLTLLLTKSLAVVTGLLAAGIIATRIQVARAEARAKAFSARWRPLILKRIIHEVTATPAITAGEWPHLFVLWNHLHESLRGEAKERLNELGREVGMPDVALRYLAGTELRRQVLALLALGNLRDERAWATACLMVEDEHPVRSAAAMRCMLMLRPAEALPRLVPLIARRTDWSPVRIAIFLKDAGPELAGRCLAKGAEDLPPPEAARLLKYLAAIGPDSAMPTVRRLLETTQEPNLLAVCLPLLRASDDMRLVRGLVDHPSWFVRVQAVVALGKHGKPGDEGLLIPLLADPQWWVRYRAAQALAGMTHLGEGWMRALHADLSDRYARDIVGQALAEYYRPA